MELNKFISIAPPKEAVSHSPHEYQFHSDGDHVTANIPVSSGHIVQYFESENIVIVHHDGFSLHMSPALFNDRYARLPQAPDGLFWWSIEDFFRIEPEEYHIYDLKQNTFIEFPEETRPLAEYIVSRKYTFKNYGILWIAAAEK